MPESPFVVEKGVTINCRTYAAKEAEEKVHVKKIYERDENLCVLLGWNEVKYFLVSETQSGKYVAGNLREQKRMLEKGQELKMHGKTMIVDEAIWVDKGRSNLIVKIDDGSVMYLHVKTT